MSSFKFLITAKYGAEIYKSTEQLQSLKKSVAKSKNQYIFLQKCEKHKIIPKSLRINSPIKSKRAVGLIFRFRFELLICIKNDSKRRFFNFMNDVKKLQNFLNCKLNEEDYIKLEQITEKSRESMFVKSKERLIKKFHILQSEHANGKDIARKTTKYKKDAVLNLCDTDISISHNDFLNLGPNFVPSLKSIPYMDIITTTESSALKLEYNNKVENAQNLRKNVLRILKTEKKINNNLTKEQRISFREIKNDETIAIYPFGKGTGFVRIEHSKALEKIREQIGPTKIISEDPTASYAAKIRRFLSKLNKKQRFSKEEYEKIYPSDPIPPLMYGVIKAHKPEKSYPMRIIISTIGTPNHGISELN
ncbi:uncharacterized protein LOC136082910 [Hydra vulgaris]|uniref:Uncharacterized protein LOC136082910 n=1 Tax=Hydra vulgaris TaxID=6087 RepID=A0ABM4C9R3_HYDVU